MTESERTKKEIEDKTAKVRSAQDATKAPGASDKDKADLKLAEQELLAKELKAQRGDTAKPKQPENLEEKMERKLDSALEDSFPGSDPVAYVQPTPAKGKDRDLTSVKASNRKS